LADWLPLSSPEVGVVSLSLDALLMEPLVRLARLPPLAREPCDIFDASVSFEEYIFLRACEGADG